MRTVPDGPAARPLPGRQRLPRRVAPRRSRGLTLIELVVAITLIGVVGGALVASFGWLSGRGVDPLMQRQALAVAESMLGEVMAQGVAVSDPDGGADGAGPEAGESRTDGANPFDHVNDYDGFDQTGVTTLDGSAVPGLGAYRVRVSVSPQAVGGMAADQGWWVEVTVDDPAGRAVVLAAWRAVLSP